MKTRWQDLRVTDNQGVTAAESLGWFVENAPANLDNAVIEHGKISEWPDYLLSAEGEDPDWDTPHGEVDWTGFEDALNTARQ
jgi:hypothetical protein